MLRIVTIKYYLEMTGTLSTEIQFFISQKIY